MLRPVLSRTCISTFTSDTVVRKMGISSSLAAGGCWASSPEAKSINMRSRAMKNIIAGTAGHIDHGKSALVRALTGIDPDRLEEEKRRGITIDLGFAHLQLTPTGNCEWVSSMFRAMNDL